MKLLSIRPTQPLALEGINASSTLSIKPGEAGWREWQLHVRGPAVFLVSPPGWQPGKPVSGTLRRVYEIPRSMVCLGWDFETADKLEDVVKFSPPPPEKPTIPAPAPEADAEAPAASAPESSTSPVVTLTPIDPDEADADESDDMPPQYKAHLAKRATT